MAKENEKRRKVLVEQLGEELGRLRLGNPTEQREMERSLMGLGQLSLLLVYERNGALQVLDGFKRLKAARKLGWKEVEVSVLTTDEPGAKLRMLTSNRRGGLTEIEEGWLVRSFYREDGLTQPQIAQLMGRHKSWVSRRLMLVEGLCEQVQADLRLGLLNATTARDLSRLPRGNQALVAKVVSRRGISTRQTTKLVDEVKNSADENEVRRILECALEALSIRKGQVEGQGSRRSPGEYLMADIERGEKLMTRMQTQLLKGVLLNLEKEAVQIIVARLKSLRGVLMSASRVIERALQRKEATEHAFSNHRRGIGAPGAVIIPKRHESKGYSAGAASRPKQSTEHTGEA